jgi:hypothetical protein
MFITEFFTLSGTTVPKDYSWDQGIPLTGTNIAEINLTNNLYISGYAPGVKVLFKNNSVTDSNFSNVAFDWSFGDYYNVGTNNITLSCNKNTEHIFIMPGIYTVSLTHRQSRLRKDFNYVENGNYCIGKYDFRWFWDNMTSLSGDTLTWDETKCVAKYSKWWDDEVKCFAKYCKFWSWYDLRSVATQGTTPVTWEQTYAGKEYEKRWFLEPNSKVCDTGNNVTFIDTVETQEQSYTITNTVEVIEIKPQAYLYSFTQPVTGTAPFTVHLTPRFTIPGSFAIEKIDWDFGDGSPIQTIWRHQAPESTIFTFTSAFSADEKDPRNYDALYTYRRSLNTYPVFYPSITAYSGSTNTPDACSLVVGPLSLSSISPKVHILKGKAHDNNNFYALQVNKNTTFITTQTADSSLQFTSTTPTNSIKNVVTPILIYKGNPGTGYPPSYNPQC